MTRLTAFLALMFPLFLLAQPTEERYPTLEIGEDYPLPDYRMKNVDGEELAFEDLMEDNGLLIVISCNTCPFVVGSPDNSMAGWEGRYPDFYELAMTNQIGFAMVNPNEAKRDKGDSFDDMVAHAEEMKYTWPYLLDENSVLANALGGKTTPHAFLFNADGELVYEGALDDSHVSADQVKNHYIADAIDALVSGEMPDPATTKAVGCSIKRKQS